MISEVGYLHDHPETEALLLGKGIQQLTEDEFLQVIDLALTGTSPGAPNLDPAASRILTGLEPFDIRKIMAQGLDINNGAMQDPRATCLLASLLAEQDVQRTGPTHDNDPGPAAPWFGDMPQSARGVFTSVRCAPSLHAGTLQLIVKRFSSLILMPVEQIDDTRALPQFGVDSMIPAEFRTWLWSTLESTSRLMIS